MSEFHNEPIIIDDWQRDDTYEGVYPSGARVKDAYFSPNFPKEECIKSDWRYLFKLSRTHFPWQFWCEIIAYRFGRIIGVGVPPAHIGLSRKYKKGVDTYAALIEWFYDDKDQEYHSGGQLLVELISDFDRVRGNKHNFETIREFFSNEAVILEYWAEVLTFDTLIGNIDRHQDNWGIIIKRSMKQSTLKIDLTTSPAFDNGTALGYEILEQNIEKFSMNDKMDRYLRNKAARHHMKWSLDKKFQQLTFYEFMKRFALAFPQIRPIIAKLLNFDRQQIEEVLRPLLGAVRDSEYQLTEKRLIFILDLIFGRKRILQETLEL